MSDIKIFGLIGKKLSHSFSQTYFRKKFIENGLKNYEYRNFQINSIEQLPKIIDLFPKLSGINVTIPYKEQIIPYLDFIDKKAKTVGAVNVVKINRYENEKPYLKGYNTDIFGFELTLKKYLDNFDKKALILGTGGAAKSVNFVLNKLDIENFYVSRSKKNSVRYTYNDLTTEIVKSHKLIINATPLGMYPKIENLPEIPYKGLSNSHILIDLIYNPALTKFLKKGKKYGAKIINGKTMLIAQAEKTWDIFFQ